MELNEMLNAMMHNKFIVFDTESTGFSTNGNFPDELTEIGAVKVVDGEIVDEFSYLIKPHLHTLNKGSAVKVTGITDELVKDCPYYEEVLYKFYKFCEGDYVFIMHNAPHDLKFITYWGNKLGLNFERPYIDTLVLARKIIDQAWLMEKEMKAKPSHKLQELAHVFNIPDPSHHRAKNDAEVTWKVFLKIRESYLKANPDKKLTYCFEKKSNDVVYQNKKVISVSPWSNTKLFRIYVNLVAIDVNGEKSYANVFYDFTKQCWGIKDTMFPVGDFSWVEETVKQMYGCKGLLQFKDFKERKYNYFS